MGLFGYPLEPRQLELGNAPQFGGDPEAGKARNQLIEDRDHFRAQEVDKLVDDFSSIQEIRSMFGLHKYVKLICDTPPPSREFLRDLFLLVKRGKL